jgi:hypothetical protein
MTTDCVDAIEQVLEQSADADEALRETVRLLAGEPGVSWAGIAFLDEGELTLGPSAGTPDEARRVALPIAFQGEPVGELWVDGAGDTALLARVAALVAGHVLVGWDTGGEAWAP